MQFRQLILNLDGLAWLIILLIPFNLIQRHLHKEIQKIFYLLTKNRRTSIYLFSIFFLPGVFLHEVSHMITARLLGVRTGRFSLIPKVTAGGLLQLGSVETERTDWLRGSLIGAAPLIVGGSIITFMSVEILNIPFLWELLLEGQTYLFWIGLLAISDIQFSWLIFYLIFVISSTMLPSPSDRHAWLPLFFTATLLLVIVVIVGAGPWMMDNIAPIVNSIFSALAMVISISGLLHLFFYIPAIWIHKLLVQVTGYDIR